MFISDALADGAAGGQAGGDMSMIIVLTVCMIAVYFFVMRPNSKKRKEMQKLLDNLAVGDEVLTNGGIAGRIVKLPDNKEYVLVAVSDTVVMQMKRNYVMAVLPKGTLVADAQPVSKSSRSNDSRRTARRGRTVKKAAAPVEETRAETAPEAVTEEKAPETPAAEIPAPEQAAPAAEAAPVEAPATAEEKK